MNENNNEQPKNEQPKKPGFFSKVWGGIKKSGWYVVAVCAGAAAGAGGTIAMQKCGSTPAPAAPAV